MSASLVGSEMCIRDSGSGGRRAEWRSGAPIATGTASRRCRQPQLRPRAVSYTHLTLPTICSV
eukprot:1756159-Alexandrium_andersonii.AAC.1